MAKVNQIDVLRIENVELRKQNDRLHKRIQAMQGGKTVEAIKEEVKPQGATTAKEVHKLTAEGVTAGVKTGLVDAKKS